LSFVTTFSEETSRQYQYTYNFQKRIRSLIIFFVKIWGWKWHLVLNVFYYLGVLLACHRID
jgi:hypothetical protein